MTCRSNRFIADVRVREVGNNGNTNRCGCGCARHTCGCRNQCGCRQCGCRRSNCGCANRCSHWQVNAVVENRGGFGPFGEEQGFDNVFAEEAAEDGHCCGEGRL